MSKLLWKNSSQRFAKQINFTNLAELRLLSISPGTKGSTSAHHQYTLNRYILPVFGAYELQNLDEQQLEYGPQVIYPRHNGPKYPLTQMKSSSRWLIRFWSKRPSMQDLFYPMYLKGCDFPFCRQAYTARHIKHRMARQEVDSSTHLVKHRWVVERTFAWLRRYRRLLACYERRAAIHLAFLTLAATLIAFRFC